MVNKVRSKSKDSIWILFVSLLLPTFASAGNSCPTDCHCLTEPNDPSKVKISCKRTSVNGENEFALFPANITSSLTVNCVSSEEYSNLVADTFKKFFNLQHLKLTNCIQNNGRIVQGLLRGLSNLRTLHLENIVAVEDGASLEVEAGAFTDLHQLEQLSFTGSRIRQIPRGAFCHLLELKLLNLSNNWIPSFDLSGYDSHNCPNHLVLLDISSNRLSRITGSDLQQMNSLHLLVLTGNHIRTVEEGAFQETTRLQKLLLGNNFIAELRDLPSALVQLDLAHNQLAIVPPALAKIQSLSRLNISHNMLDSNTPFFLQGNRLESLDLSFNRFQKIPSRLFENTSSLTELFLENNFIEVVEGEAFKTLDKLIHFSLANNKLVELKRIHAQGLSNLTQLHLQNNSLSEVEDGVFAAVYNLHHLNLATNILLEVPTGLTRLYHLRSLDISDNKISTIHKFLFEKLPNLQELNLSNNRLSKIERYLFEDVAELRVLNLANNGIEMLSAHCFDRNPNLREIHLESNLLPSVANVFETTVQLSFLNLTENKLKFMDYSMFHENINTLLASRNQIGQLTNENASRPIKLKHLDLSMNKLTFLNGLFIPSTVLTANFSHNRIQSLSIHSFYNKGDLEWVDLRGNRIRDLDQSSLESGREKTQSYRVFLSDNPLICSCHMEWMKRQERGLETSLPTVVDYRRVFCRQPHTGFVSEIHKLESSDLLCPYEVMCNEECLCCDFDSCDCKNVCPEECTCYRDSSFSNNIVQCSELGEKGITTRLLPMYATHIYLDGVHFPQIKKHSFLGRFRTRHLYINSSGVRAIEPRAFNGLTSLQLLDLSDNQLTEIRGDEFYNTPKLLHLFLNSNKLRFLGKDAFSRLPALRSLTLHNNQINLLPPVIPGTAQSLFALTLAGNPWRCDCKDRFLIQQWLPSHQSLVRDFESVYCFENLSLSDNPATRNQSTVLTKLPATEGSQVVKVNFWTFRKEMNRTFCLPTGRGITEEDSRLSEGQPEGNMNIILAAVIVSACLLLLLMVLMAVKIRGRCQSLAHTHYGGAHSLNSSATTSTPVPLIAYDAFVSYSYADETFVLDKLVPLLENHPPYYQLRLLYRDLSTKTFSTCHLIHDDIIKEMERSHTLLMVLTPAFLSNEWEMVQIRTAHQCFLKDKQKRLVVILVGDRECLLHNLDPMLGHYFRTSICLSWKDPFFWERLRDALPARAQDTLTNSAVYSDLYGTIVPSKFV